MSENGTEKDKRVQAEVRRLNKVFRNIEGLKKDFLKKQIASLAWYNVSIEELRTRIDKYGTMIRYDNGGGQSGFKDNPDVKTLIQYQKHANYITAQLLSLLPKELVEKEDEFEAYLAERDQM